MWNAIRYSLWLLLGTMAPQAPAQAQTAKLSNQEEKAIAAYLKLIRASVHPDGAINMTERGATPNSPVWIAPYFADHVAISLLVANDYRKNPNDVALVGKWIEWRLTRQDKGGFWYDYVGTNANYKSNGKVDAHDSSAALFMILIERYQRAGGRITDRMRTAAKICLKGLESLQTDEGLTWAKPDYKVLYLMDNIEVGAGYKAGELFFNKTNDVAEAKICGQRATAINKRLLRYYEAKDKGLFSWALHPNGTYDGGFDKLYPCGLGQLFAVAYLRSDAELFERVVQAFPPETGPTATGSERYLIAASRLGGKYESTWRAKVVNDASLLKKETYNYRPALAIMGLLEGAKWMPR